MVEAYISNGFIHENKTNAGVTHLLEHIITESWKKALSNILKEEHLLELRIKDIILAMVMISK